MGEIQKGLTSPRRATRAKVSGRVASSRSTRAATRTNGITGVAEPANSGSSELVLSADTAARDVDAVDAEFRTDQDEVTRAVGAVSERVASVGTAPPVAAASCGRV